MPAPHLRSRGFVKRRGSALYTPASIAGLGAWWDASKLSLSDGAVCSTWGNSQGTAGRDMSSSGTARPTFRAGLKNGLGVLQFDGSDDKMSAAGAVSTYISASAFTFAAVFCPTSLTLNNGTPYGNHPILAGSADYFGLFAKNSSPTTILGYTWQTGAKTVSADFAGANNWCVVVFRLIAGASFKLSLNGAADITAVSEGISAGSGMSGELRAGAGGSQFFPGYIAELATWPLAVSDGESILLAAALKQKWGVT